MRARVPKKLDKAVLETLELLMAIPVTVLSDKFGFTPTQLEDFCDKVLYLIDSYERGYVTMEELRETLKDEAGVEIRRKAVEKQV